MRSFDLSVRDATPADAARIAAVYNDAVRARRSTMDTEPIEAARFAEEVREMSPREVMLVGETEDGVVGWSRVKRYSHKPGYDRACETSVYVADQHQGRGYGRALQRAVMERAAELGYGHLAARIWATNESSIRFHEDFGYELVGRQRRIGYVDGAWQDVVIMQCILDDAG